MPSSLAAQLAQGASLNAALLTDRSRRKPTESYLFSAKEARQHDIDSLYALGVNGFLQLKSLNPALRDYEHVFFSDAAKAMDRTLQPTEANAHLDRALVSFLPLLGPYLMDAPTGKVIEWLVRRFRINEFNVADVLRLFLPYHESPHFAKMVTILHIDDQSSFRFLQAYKTNGKAVPRTSLVTEMAKSSDLARFVSSLLPEALKAGSSGTHRALVAFHTGVLLDFIAKSSGLDEGTVAHVLPAAMEPLRSVTNPDLKLKANLAQEIILGCYLLLAALSQKCRLSPKALRAILSSVATCVERVSAKQYMRTIVAISAPQDELAELPRNMTASLTKIPGMDEELQAGLLWTGSEKVAGPLVDALISGLADASAFTLLTSLLICEQIPSGVSRRAIVGLFHVLLEESTSEATENARKLLAQLQQRQSRQLQQAFDSFVAQREEKQEVLEQILLSLSLKLPNSSKAQIQEEDTIVASLSADSTVRTSAVRDLLTMLSSTSLPATELDAAKSALRARVLDINTVVLDVLYGTPDQILPVFLEDAEAYVSSVVTALHKTRPSPPRPVIRQHLSFIAEHFFPAISTAHPSLAHCIFEKVFFPYFLFSKPRQKTATLVWEILEARSADYTDTTGIGRYELLAGCVDAVRWEQGRQNEDSQQGEAYRQTEELTRINLALAAKIADNIVSSNLYSEHADRLLAILQHASLYSRILAYLITRALLSRLSGEHRIDAAHKILQAMNVESLEAMGEFMRGVDNLQAVSTRTTIEFRARADNSLQFLHDTSLGTAVVLKPNSRFTMHRLQVSILVMLPNIPRPSATNLDWLAPASQTLPEAADTRGIRYIELLRTIYRLSNSSSSMPLLSTHLLRILFVNLGDDALAFLTGLCLYPAADDEDEQKRQTHVQYAALRHAAAFLQAHCATEHWVDFQTILPSLLLMLGGADIRVREAASDCISILAQLSTAQSASSVYAFDSLYGANSEQLQYAEWSDLRRYTAALNEAREHFVPDSHYLHVFHQQHLTSSRTDSKKETAYKQRILCYLLSHVIASHLPYMKLLLLDSLKAVSSSVKLQMLLPSIQKLVQNVPEGHDEFFEQFASLSFRSFDATVVSYLESEGSSWSTFEQVLRLCYEDARLSSPRASVAVGMRHGLFAKLRLENQAKVCHLLLVCGIKNLDMVSECKALLADIVQEVPLIIKLLISLRPRSDDAQRAAKRVRLESSASDDQIEDKLSALSLLAEVLGSKPVPGSLDLIACLLDTLSKVVHDASAAAADKNYIEQLLITAIENTVSSVPENTDLSSATIRVEILVELIRASDNPQTFHQALLLVASLARLTPDAVLHNIMPVFTFMGSNVFHRDDTYSFRVVQKTIDSIVPVMVASLKRAHTSPLDLSVASRDFLRIFTDASNHIPRHRRAHFFTHFVDVLGPDDFLAPVSMLLVDRMSSRVVRQSSQDARNSLSLPLAVLEHYTASRRLSVLLHALHEVGRLLAKEAGTTDGEVCFLDSAADDDDQAGHAVSVPRRRALALLIFADHALRAMPVLSSAKSVEDGSFSSQLLSLLLDLAVKSAAAAMVDVAATAQTALTSVLNIMPAADFVTGALSMIESPDVKVQAGAFDLVGERLLNVVDKVRRDVTSTVIKIVECTRKILSSKPEADLTRAALHALDSVARTVQSGEESIITTTVPLVLDIAQIRSIAPSALRTLLSLCSTLGPRVIPVLKDIVRVCANVIRESFSGTEASDDEITAAALSVLQELLSAVPNFWSNKELVQVINLYLDSSFIAKKTTAVAPLIKSLAKRAPSKSLLNTLSDLWFSSGLGKKEDETAKCLAFFDVFKRSIRAAARPVVLEHLRILFKTFLDAFEVACQTGGEEVEGQVISAFLELVIKLNETAFKPLFRKLFDWAYTNETGTSAASRKVTFLHVYVSLLDYFKGLMVPYMAFVWQPSVKLLDDFSSGSLDNESLWLAILKTLSKSFENDEGAFWREDRLRQLVPSLVKQVDVCIRVNAADSKSALSECLVALAGVVNDDAILKSLNLDVLMHTRSEDARLRLYSLSCAGALWHAHGSKLLGFVAETTTFIAECAEDDNDSVVREAHKLKSAVESVAGNIDV
ncbi:hypothetical protein CERSUDRAFT_107124 [Gelatoporia subvermispora B]|uniref:U3 small nucleolar RNA-associated protein 10 n=1 Tax=Ceriporiopsis subvermispora (strain B) TaxID=914234 RepID=M2R8T0_CERS8|nr:hypothetical protein CERSUDRAFT_107124 [Gelatoporia subvermispora B]